MEAMTGHLHHPHVPVASPADLAAELHARGLRMTPQRDRVLAAVRELGHATPEQISEAVPEIDLTTVYRTLELFESVGLVRHAHLGHGPASYRPAEDDHIHVVCHDCGRVLEAPADLVDELERRLLEASEFTLDRAHFTVFGRCGDCVGGDRLAAPGTDGAENDTQQRTRTNAVAQTTWNK
jgi:Fur family ferric uptake transcriptional regulator